MPDTELGFPWTTYAALLLAGLGGSLHCIGMCGPILVGFHAGFARAAARGQRVNIPLAFAAYHAGRVWTYAAMGLASGWLGHGLRQSAAWLGWQRWGGLALSLAAAATGLILLGVVPGWRARRLAHACGFSRFSAGGWFKALLASPGPSARVLLGVVMGFLPCGLVYAALALASSMPSPWHAAGGMAVFGLGTLPALSLALVTAHLVPARWRVHGTRLAAVVIVLAASWMGFRALAFSPERGCPACSTSHG